MLPETGEMKWSESCSVVSDSLQPCGLYSPWNSAGQNTGVGSLSLLQGIFPTQGLNPGLLHCRRILYQLSHQGSPQYLNKIGLWGGGQNRKSCLEIFVVFSLQFSSVTQSCSTLCDPMDCSPPGLPVHHQPPEFAQTHVHRVGDAIQPSHPLFLCRPLLLPCIFPSIRIFSKESGLHIRWPKLVEFQLQHHPSNEYSGLNPHQPPTAIFMSALWDTVPPHEVCRAGCCPSRRPGEGSSCALTGAGSTWLEGGLVPKARLRPGTPLQTPRWIPNCWSVFDFPHEIRLNIWVHKYLGLQTAVREGLAGCRLRLHTGQIYAAPWKLPKPTRRCNEEFPATHTPHRQVSTTNFLLLEELSNKAFFSPIKW